MARPKPTDKSDRNPAAISTKESRRWRKKGKKNKNKASQQKKGK